MKDGLTNVPIDRMLMRVKDVCSICASLLNILMSISTIIFVIYCFFTKIDGLVNQINILQQQQSATQQIVVNAKRDRGDRGNQNSQ